MATIVLNKHTRSDGTIWYEVVNDGDQVYATDIATRATARYRREVASAEVAEEDSTVVEKSHVIVGAPAV